MPFLPDAHKDETRLREIDVEQADLRVRLALLDAEEARIKQRGPDETGRPLPLPQTRASVNEGLSGEARRRHFEDEGGAVGEGESQRLELVLDAETYKPLRRAGYRIPQQILASSDEQLLAIDGIDPCRLQHIREAVG